MRRAFDARRAALRDAELVEDAKLRVEHAAQVERLHRSVCTAALGVRGREEVRNVAATTARGGNARFPRVASVALPTLLTLLTPSTHPSPPHARPRAGFRSRARAEPAREGQNRAGRVRRRVGRAKRRDAAEGGGARGGGIRRDRGPVVRHGRRVPPRDAREGAPRSPRDPARAPRPPRPRARGRAPAPRPPRRRHRGGGREAEGAACDGASPSVDAAAPRRGGPELSRDPPRAARPASPASAAASFVRRPRDP